MTIRGVDPRLERTLRSEARRRGLSLNRTVLGLLREATGLHGSAVYRAAPERFGDLDHLAGTWSAEEAATFERHVQRLRGLDAELWR
jgi:hypothetical protein